MKKNVYLRFLNCLKMNTQEKLNQIISNFHQGAALAQVLLAEYAALVEEIKGIPAQDTVDRLELQAIELREKWKEERQGTSTPAEPTE